MQTDGSTDGGEEMVVFQSEDEESQSEDDSWFDQLITSGLSKLSEECASLEDPAPDTQPLLHEFSHWEDSQVECSLLDLFEPNKSEATSRPVARPLQGDVHMQEGPLDPPPDVLLVEDSPVSTKIEAKSGATAAQPMGDTLAGKRAHVEFLKKKLLELESAINKSESGAQHVQSLDGFRNL